MLFTHTPNARLALTCQLLEHIPGKNTFAGKPRSFSHQLQECGFTLGADHSGVAQIDHELTLPKIVASIVPGLPEFVDPRLNKLPFDNQAALGICVDCRDLQHPVCEDRNTRAKSAAPLAHR